MNVRETVDLLTCQVRSCSHQIIVFRILCQLIGQCEGIQRRADDRIINRILNLFTKHPQVQIQLSQGLDILIFCHHNRVLSFLNVFVFCAAVRSFKRTNADRLKTQSASVLLHLL